MNKPHAITLLILCCLLVGCMAQPSPKVVSPLTNTAQPPETSQPSPAVDVGKVTGTFTPTPTPAPTITPTPSLTLTSTPISLPLRTADRTCLTVEPQFSGEFISSGAILFEDINEQAPVRFGVLGITALNLDLEMLDNAPRFFYNGAISPDGRWLAYNSILFENGDFANNFGQLVVIDATGQVQAAMDWNVDWIRMIGWLDTKWLVLMTFDVSWSGFDIVNPFSGESQHFSPALADMFIQDPVPLVDPYPWKMVFNPSLTRVAYMRGIPGIPKWEFNLVLKDIEANSELLVLKEDARFDWPAWSPDNSRVAFIVQDRPEDNFERFELYIIDWEGKVEKWIDLRGHPGIGNFGRLRWSPDGRYLAIGGKPLIILDMAAKQIWDTCLHGGYAEKSRSNDVDVIYWSPDSKQLLVTFDDDPGIVVDVEQRKAAKVNNDPLLLPIGWLALP